MYNLFSDKKLTVFLLFSAPFFFYLGMLYLTFSIIFAAIILWQRDKQIYLFSTNNLPLLFIILFYLLCLFSFFWSSDQKNWLIDSRIKLTLLLIPAFYVTGKTNKGRLYELLKYYFYASILVSVIHLIIFSYRYFIEGKEFHTLISSYFSLFMHPSYMSMYLDFSLVSGFILVQKKILSPKIFFTGIFFILTTIFIAMSKIAFFTTAIIALYIVFNYTSKLIRNLSIAGFLLLAVLGFYASPKFNEMKIAISNYHNVILQPKKQTTSTAERILTWNASLQVFLNNNITQKILGLGTGDEKAHLINFYKQHDYILPLQKKLNSHNQFFETLLGTGITGLTLLLLSFTLAFLNAIKNNNKFLLWFLIITFLNFTVESMLNRQAGVLFFAFWFSVLNKYYPNE